MSETRDENGELMEVATLKLQPEHRLFSRLKELLEFYSSQYGKEPDYVVRVPGRVNIIGEHVDYCGYPVLPMAIDQCILLAVGHNVDSSMLHLRNMDNEKYENFNCDMNDINIDVCAKGGPEWYKYYLCGVKGVFELLDNTTRRPLGMQVALSGNIPPSSGLSSSSALVSAAVLATAHALQLPLERKHLASVSARCERYIGTQGGGMDQAIAYLAKPGCAQFIEFHPELNATPIPLPDGACFIVANSLAAKNKAASSDFNERVVECRLAARMIAKLMKLPNWYKMTRFVELQEAIKCDLNELERLALELLAESVYTRAELCEVLDVEEEKFLREFLTVNTQHMHKFKLRQRALHVIQESIRVAQFRAICEQIAADSSKHCNGTNGNSKQQYQQIHQRNGKGEVHALLSELMRQSHRSLQELYECSHPDLERLVGISDTVGVGARLTGAGWGGCIVALCDSPETTKSYMEQLKQEYFMKLPTPLLERHQGNDFSEVVFATMPGSGAEIWKLESK